MTVLPLSGFGHLCLVRFNRRYFTKDNAKDVLDSSPECDWLQKYTPLFPPDSSPVLAQHSKMKGH